MKRISGNYSCVNCCGNSFYDGWVTPGPTVGFVGEEIEITALQQDMNCYGQTFSPFPALAAFSAAAPSICDPSSGSTILFAPGQTSLYGVWRVDSWSPGVGGYCEYSGADILRDAVCNVVASVDKIQYQNGSNFVDIDGTLFVLKGSTVTFKAVPHPSYATFPEGKPIWSGTAGVSGNGQTISYTFNTASTGAEAFTTITATSGNTKSVNVIVFELTGELTPNDNFSGRSLERFGVTERVTLAFTVTPSGVTAAQAGGLEWMQTSGAGSLDAGPDGTGTYDVASTPGSATLKLKILDGPSKDSGPIKNITVVAPSGGSVVKQPLSGIKHFQDWWSCGFVGDIFVSPNDVSFFGVAFKEEEVGASASGWLSFLNNTGHCLNGICPQSFILNGIGGGRVDAGDEIFSGAFRSQDHGPYATGSVTWAIPWKWGVTGGTWQPLTSVNQTATSTSTGRCSISKGGSGSFSRELGAPTSEW